MNSFSIATQCPMIGGNAVYKARSLYSLVDDSYEFDDALLCLPHGIIVKSLMQPSAELSIVPNPARDEATLVLSEPLEEQGELVLFDAIGNEVIRYNVPKEMIRFQFSTGSLAPALYHYRVIGSAGMLGHGKLTVVR